MKRALVLLAVAACADAPEPETSELEQAATVNGSFETGDYAGWTLLETPQSPEAGTFAIVADGQTIVPAEQVFDFADQVLATVSTPGAPITFDATAGTLLAAHFQTGSQNHRMFQTVTVPTCSAFVAWDMKYTNHNNAFEPSSQFSAVHLRDPGTDAILTTLYKTTEGTDPQALAAMTPFEVDLAAFAGQTVVLDFEHQVQSFFFDIAWDNIRIACSEPQLTPIPASVEFGNVRVGTPSAPQLVTLRNTGGLPLTIDSIATSPPFTVLGLPSLPLILAPEAEVAIQATFTPPGLGAMTGTITVGSDDPVNPSRSIELSGTGVAPAVSIDPPVLAFGPQRVATTGEQAITITNTGTDVLNVSSVTTTGPFAVPAIPPFALAPGASRVIPVGFTPPSAGLFTGTVLVISDANPTGIQLTGTGIAPEIAIDPTSLAFGTQRVGTTAERTLIVSNPGSDTLTISSVTVGGAFAILDALPIVVAAGGTTTLTASFTPPGLGTFTADLTIDSDAASSPTLVPVSGTGVAPAIAVDPLSLAFGNQRIDTLGARTLVVSNPGTDTLTITAIAASGVFGTTDLLPIVIAPGGDATLNVTFEPTALGPAEGVLTIISDAATSPTSVPLFGIGVAPAIAVNPASLEFGDQRVQTTGIRTLVIENPGSDTLTITSITTDPPFANTDVLPLAIPPGGTAVVSVSFTPQATGVIDGSLAIASDAGPAVVPLRGTGVEPLIQVSGAPVAFGNRRVGVTGAPRTVVVTNSGTSILTIASIAIPAPFAASGPIPFVLLPNESAAISITFTPDVAGAVSHPLTITSDAAGGPTTFQVSGTGVEPGLTPSATSLAFGTVKTGTASASQTFTLTNTGDFPAVVTAANAPAQFVLSTPPLPITVLPNAELTFGVTFAPTSDGAASGSITFTSDAPSVPAITVEGTGGSPQIVTGPGALDFGDVAVGTISDPVALAITNPGPAALVVTGVTATEPFARASIVLPVTIEAGGSRTINIVFAPSAPGAAAGTITITSDAGSSAVVPVSGTGLGLPELAEGGCCSSTPGGTSSLLLAAFVLGLVRRRRRP